MTEVQAMLRGRNDWNVVETCVKEETHRGVCPLLAWVRRLTWLCGALDAGVEGGQHRAVDGPLEAWRQVRGAAAHHLLAEVPTGTHH